MNNCVNFNNSNICNCNNPPYCNGIGTNSCCTGIIPYCSRDCCNQCGKCFCCNCCCCCPVAPIPPIPPFPPIPPMPPMPPIPPIPPIPPGPVISSGQFISIMGIPISHDMSYRFNNVNLMGNLIAHINGSTDIMLAPNTRYRYTWVTETVVAGAVDVPVTNALFLNGLPLIFTGVTNIAQPGIVLAQESDGVIVTQNVPSILQLRYLGGSPMGDQSNASLSLSAI